MNIYVENLHKTIDNKQLKDFFSPYGEVLSAEIVQDVFTGVSRGFGYVVMENDAAQNAINKLNETVWNNLTIIVKEAPPTKEKKGSYKVGNGAVNVYRFKKN